VRVSSTLLWTQAVQDLQVNAPFRWIRPTWLLLFQLLALACLVVAIGRPAIDASGGRGNRVIILIDRSASMSATDGDSGETSRLEVAKARARELVDRSTSRGDARAMIVTFSADASSLTGLTRDRGLLKAAIDSIEPTDQPGDLDAALRLVETIATRERAESDTGPFRVVLLSDVGTPINEGSTEGGLEGATLEFIRVGPDPPAARDNVGIVSLSMRRDYDDPSVIRAFVRVLSTITRPTDVAIRLTLDTETLETSVIKLPAATPESPAIGVRTLTFASAAGGTCVVSLLRSDSLASDNTAACIVPASSALRIGLVRRGEPDVAGSALEQALASLEPFELRIIPAGRLTAASGGPLEGIELVVLDRVAPSILPTAPTLSFGASLPIAGMTVAASTSGDDSVAFWERTHPVMRYLTLANVRLGSGSRVRINEQSLTGVGVRSVTLASGLHGALISLLEQGLTRRIVVGFALSDTNWWRSDSFPIFVANAVDYLTRRGDEGGGELFTTTQPVRVPASPGASLELIGPESTRRTAVADSEGVAAFGVLPRVGIYSWSTVERRAPREVGVNLLSEAESGIATRNGVVIAGRAISGSTTATGPREVWGWFALAGLILLTLEWLIFAWRMRV